MRRFKNLFSMSGSFFKSQPKGFCATTYEPAKNNSEAQNFIKVAQILLRPSRNNIGPQNLHQKSVLIKRATDFIETTVCQDYLDKINTLINEHQYAQATRLATQAIDDFKNIELPNEVKKLLAQIYFQRGSQLYDSGYRNEKETGKNDFKMAYELDPSFKEAKEKYDDICLEQAILSEDHNSPLLKGKEVTYHEYVQDEKGEIYERARTVKF